MNESITTAFKELRTIVTVYVIALGHLFLEFYGSGGLNETSTIFRIKIPEVKYPLAYGILFFIFILTLTIKMRLLQNLMRLLREQKPELFNESALYLKYFPWIISPFQLSNHHYRGFWLTIGTGTGYLFYLSITHMISRYANKTIFELMGFIDLILFFLILWFIYLLYNYLKEIRVMIKSVTEHF